MFKQPKGQRISPKGNQKIPCDKSKGKHNTPNLRDAVKAMLRRQVPSTDAHLQKEKRFQIDNLTSFLKELKKEKRTKPELAEEGNNQDQNGDNQNGAQKNRRIKDQEN